jgi:putative thioredoxin
MTKPTPKAAPEKAAADKPKLELTGHSTAVGADPVIDQYRRRLSMTVLS